MMNFTQIPYEKLHEDPVTMFKSKWALITAGDENGCNTMTASWGAMGELWNTDVCMIFVRDSRYTKEFIDNHDHFTVSILPEAYRDALKLCGTQSGRDTDKFQKAGITPFFTDGTCAVQEAETVFVCKKLSATPLLPGQFLDKKAEDCYTDSDYHTLYIGEIRKIYSKK